MTIDNVTEKDITSLRDWTAADGTLTHDQELMCVALERLGCNAMPSEIAAYCKTTEERILELKRGIHGILIDANSGRFWIR